MYVTSTVSGATLKPTWETLWILGAKRIMDFEYSLTTIRYKEHGTKSMTYFKTTYLASQTVKHFIPVQYLLQTRVQNKAVPSPAGVCLLDSQPLPWESRQSVGQVKVSIIEISQVQI